MATKEESNAAAIVSQLYSSHENRVVAARMVKNAVVGNPTNKRLYLKMGVFEPLLTAASDVHLDPVLVENAVSALGSLSALLAQDSVAALTPVLLSAFFVPDSRAVKAAMRALKMLVTAEVVDMRNLSEKIATEVVANRLVKFLSISDEGIAEVCAVIVSKTTIGGIEASTFGKAGVVPALVSLLCRTNHERCLEACLNALSELARQDRSVVKLLVTGHKIIDIVLPFMGGQIHPLRLASCRLLTTFHSVVRLPSGLDIIVAAALVDLLSVKRIESQIATTRTLADLVLSSEELQRVAYEADAIEKLVATVKDIPCHDYTGPTFFNEAEDDYRYQQRLPQSPSDRVNLHASSLTALAALCSDFDDAREKVVSLGVLHVIYGALSTNEEKVVLAATKCLRSISRSMKIVCRDIANETLGQTMLGLMKADSFDVRIISSATLCNLVLQFSPIRAIILQDEGIRVLEDLLSSKEEELRENALRIVRNLLFKVNDEIRILLMKKLGCDNLLLFCSDPLPRIKALALTVLRNLTSATRYEARKNEQLDDLLCATGNKLKQILCDALHPDVENADIAVQALYVVCNIASGSEEHKKYLMCSEIPQLVLEWTSHGEENVRVAAIWCTINLAWREHTEFEYAPRAVRRNDAHCFQIPGRASESLRNHQFPSQDSASNAETHGSTGMDIEYTSAPSSHRSNGGLRPLWSADNSPQVPDSRERNAGYIAGQDDIANLHGKQEMQVSSGYQSRIDRLRELGFEDRLRSLLDSPHVEVQGRAKAALGQFLARDEGSFNYDPFASLGSDTSATNRQSLNSPTVLLRVADMNNAEGSPT